MQVTLTLKNRLYRPPAEAFQELCSSYARACSYVSKVYFDHGTDLGLTKLHNRVYKPIRNMFGLKAQEADSVPRTVRSHYKSVNTQLYRDYQSYQDRYTKKYFHLSKSVKDLWHPIHFHSPQADLVYKNDWSILPKQHRLSINTLGKRAKVKFYLPEYYDKYLQMPHKLGTAKLIHKRTHWYLYVSCKITAPSGVADNIVGNDRGLRFIYYSYNSDQHSSQLNGLRYRKQRSRFLKQRKILQHKHTKAAERKLRQMSGRENCWMNLINHQASKALVQSQPKNSLFVLENLRGIRFTTQNAPKYQRYGLVSWPFYQFGAMLTYKALLNQSQIVHINPHFTSQRCPKCGHVLADSRQHDIHTYICKYCGYTSNDDRIGAMNIRALGYLDEQGYKNPTILQDGKIRYYKLVKAKGGKEHQRYKKKYTRISRKRALKILNVMSRNRP